MSVDYRESSIMKIQENDSEITKPTSEVSPYFIRLESFACTYVVKTMYSNESSDFAFTMSKRQYLDTMQCRGRA